MSAYREAWRLAWPLILSNLSIPLLGVVDTAVVGHLPSPHYLGAVAIGAMVLSVVYFLFGFLRMGTTGLTAQAFGRGDHAECFGWLARGILLALLIAALLLLLAKPLIAAAMVLFEPGARVEGELETYLAIRLLGAPAALVTMVLLGWLLGLQNARGPMLLLVLTNGLNIALDLLFVLGFGWAVAGVAWATVAAEYAGMALGLWLARRSLAAWSWGAVWHAQAFRRLFVVNRDMFLRSLSLEAAFLDLQRAERPARRGRPRRQRGALQPAPPGHLRHRRLLACRRGDGRAPGRAPATRRALRAAFRANMAWALGLALLLALALVAFGPAAIRGMTGIAGGAGRGHGLPALSGRLAADLGLGLPARWRVHRRHPHGRDAQRHGGLAAGVLARGLAADAAPGQPRPLAAFLLLMSARGLWLGAIYARHEPEAWVAARH